MTLFAITVMIFVVTLGLSISAIYFFVVAPATRKRLRTRLGALQHEPAQPSGGLESSLLREEMISGAPVLDRMLRQTLLANRLQMFVLQSGMAITVPALLLLAFSISLLVFLLGLLTFIPVLLMAGLAICAGTIPFGVVAFVRQRRLSKFQEMFPDAIDMLARAVRAGHAFTTALELIARELPEPLAGEFRITYEQQNFGLPLREALGNLAARVPLPDVHFFVSALQIQRETGGNLGEILDNLSQVIRERFKILRQVKVFTAQGRLTMYILMALGPGFAGLMYLRNPKYIGRLFTDPFGQKALALGILAQIIGFLVIRKIIRIRV